MLNTLFCVVASLEDNVWGKSGEKEIGELRPYCCKNATKLQHLKNLSNNILSFAAVTTKWRKKK